MISIKNCNHTIRLQAKGDETIQKIKDSSEDMMILEFLKGEWTSKRFHEKLRNVLLSLHLSSDLIEKGDITDPNQNDLRRKIMKLFRGYPNQELFKNFPPIEKWVFVSFDSEDLDHIYYIDYDYWNELSSGTSKPKEAAKNIEQGIEIYQVSNTPFIEGVSYLQENAFPPVILITCNDEKYLIIEGHSRMTVYGMCPSKFSNTYGYIGYCTKEDMLKYDERMSRGEK